MCLPIPRDPTPEVEDVRVKRRDMLVVQHWGDTPYRRFNRGFLREDGQ